MENSILLEIVTPEKILISEQVDEVTAPGFEGEFGVLPGHTEFMTLLKIGEISYKKEGKKRYVAVSFGYAEVGHEKVTILAETAERAEHIDISRAEKRKKEVEVILGSKDIEEKEFHSAEISLQKALIRMQVAAKPHENV